MPTAAQIITYARTVYPRATASIFTDAFCLENLNDIHTEIFLILRRLTNNCTTDKTILTVADQAEYNLPSKCRVENIESLRLWLTNDYYEGFDIADAQTYTRIGRYYKYGTTGAKIELLVDDNPIKTTGLVVEIRYYPIPTLISAANQTPELDEQYHHLLKYKLINRLASIGEVIDIDLANAWQQEYDNALRIVREDLSRKKNKPITQIKNVYGGW